MNKNHPIAESKSWWRIRFAITAGLTFFFGIIATGLQDSDSIAAGTAQADLWWTITALLFGLMIASGLYDLIRNRKVIEQSIRDFIAGLTGAVMAILPIVGALLTLFLVWVLLSDVFLFVGKVLAGLLALFCVVKLVRLFWYVGEEDDHP